MLFLVSDVLIRVWLSPRPDFGVVAGTEGVPTPVLLGVVAGADAVRSESGGTIPGIPPPVIRQALSAPIVTARTSSALTPISSRRQDRSRRNRFCRESGDPYGGCGTRREHRVIRVNPLAVVPGLPQPGRTLVMGVVNVTPDSFSDGGEWLESQAAISHGLDLMEEGADIIDIGGESTRPGATRPEVSEELRRVLPVIRELVAAGACVSVDTMRTAVAEPAIAAGARVVNDVSGGKADPAMLRLIAASGVAYVCMHWRGHSEDMQSRASYGDVVSDVIAELRAQLEQADSAGVGADRVIIDPGFGFAKTGEHNWQLLNRLEEFEGLGRPLLVGVSRKTFLGRLLAGADGSPRPPKQRDDATTALTTMLALRGVWGVRVHSVQASRDAIAVVQRLLKR
jgi:dihydropteroate synthase